MDFIGLDLAWSGRNPSGLAHLTWDGKKSRLRDTAVVTDDEDILAWIRSRARTHACIGIDAPIIAPNSSGTRRPADAALSRDFRRFDAGVYPANSARARRAVGLSKKLARLGYSADPAIAPGRPMKRQFEVYPHSAMVVLFSLEKIVKYKKGSVTEKQRGLRGVQMEMGARLPVLVPPVDRLSLLPICREMPEGKRGKILKDLEDRLDAVLCAYIGLYYWYWGDGRCRVYGDRASGYIVTPIDERIPQAHPRH